MSHLRVELAHEFLFGDDVVLLAMDGGGLGLFLQTLRQAFSNGCSQLEHQGVSHEFVIQEGESAVEFGEGRTAWRFNAATATGVVDYLTALHDSDRPGHQYVDISQPTDTLVLSLNEYVGK